MSKKSLPIVFPIVVLLIASLACNRLTGGAASGPQATVDAAFTQAAASAATAGVQGSSVEATANAAASQAVGAGDSGLATANAAATEAIATTNAATGGNTSDSTATPAADQPTAAATTAGGGSTANGGPDDIPLVDANNTVLVASAQLVSYQTSADAATTIKFYKDTMPTKGWTVDANLTVETPTATILAFTKDSRSAQVSITGDPTSQKTIVVIMVS
jgi:hypothetical protein